jgi:multicomponent Na+:H+ antiporter subunit E
MSTILYGLGLAVVWVLLWGALSWANVLSGIVVAAVLIALFVPGERRHSHRPTIRPAALVRLGAFLLRQLFVSNVTLIREVFARRERLQTNVILLPVTGCSEQLVTVIANFMAMSPGTMPVEVELSPDAYMRVHLLHLGPLEEAEQGVIRLRDLTVRAIGTSESMACVGVGVVRT